MIKRYIVTVHCDDIIAVVLAKDEDDAIDKYHDDNVEEYLEPVSQPDFTAELESEVEAQEEQARSTADMVVIQRPIECKDYECSHCPLYYDEMGRKQIGCPYVD